MLSFLQLEKIIKECASHRRIHLLITLFKEPSLSEQELSKLLSVNFKTVFGHLSKLTSSGLLIKKRRGMIMTHRLTPLGHVVLTFLKKLKD
jgi:predicted transcriptional regulator